MELKPGYRQTEVGVIPEEWEVNSLGNCLSARPDYGINAPAVSYSDKLPVYIRITDITEDGRFSPEKLVSVDNAESGNYYLSDGDIVFARTGASVGKSYRYDAKDGQLVFAGFLVRVRPDPRKLLSAFAAAYVTTGSYWNWVRLMSMRSGQPGINGNEYAQLPIPLPPLPEQRAIAGALGDVDALLGALTQLIAKKRDLKQATMQQLLTGQARLPGFSGEWEVKRLGEIAQIGRGRVISHREISTSQSSLYPVYSSQTSNNGVMGYIDTYDFDGEYVTWTTDGVNAGKVFYRKGRFNCTNVCGTIKVLSRDAKLVALALDRVARKYVSTNLANPKLMNGVMKQIELLLPPTVEEQTAIAAVLSDMDTEIAALEARLAKTRALKRGMMQELLTGKTRLPVRAGLKPAPT